jgi:hypothetical protein
MKRTSSVQAERSMRVGNATRDRLLRGDGRKAPRCPGPSGLENVMVSVCGLGIQLHNDDCTFNIHFE